MATKTAARRVFSGATWEAKVGYCRAVRRGPHVWVSGTAPAREDGTAFGRGDPEKQARRCIDVIRRALEGLDADLRDVVRTRIYVTDRAHWPAVGRVHADAFGDAPPATTLVVVAGLIDPDMLVEIEAEAFTG